MKKTAIIVAAVAGSVLTAGNISGGRTQTKNSDSYVGGVVDEIATQAADELRKAFTSEVSDFLLVMILQNPLVLVLKSKIKLRIQLNLTFAITVWMRKSCMRQENRSNSFLKMHKTFRQMSCRERYQKFLVENKRN